MAIPRQEFFSLDELAARWTAQRYQIGQWAAQGGLDLVTGIPPVEAEGEELAGIVSVPGADLLPLFRRDGSGPEAVHLHRLRKIGEVDWRKISAPASGVLVAGADLLVTAQEAFRFENEHEIFGRRLERNVGGGKFELRYDWDAFWRAVAVRVHAKGVPETLKEFVDEMEAWFMDASPTGDCPSDSVIRKRLSPLWRELRRGDV